ncbi:glycine betaine ABC transporter substrate-binding protein [Neisseria sp. Ec49-e6-T10]|uniref:glycine betaine ABC transporter substrate-binding protein n=1 Tax=Neisseria sp. Ec49-e6-T10 TaxID=3140744 RepID=UPI003EBAFE16
MKKIISIFVMVCCVFLVASCSDNGSTTSNTTAKEQKEVSILYPSWAEGVAVTYLSKVVLEEKGYKVDLKRLEPGLIYASLSKGDADVYMDAWLPYTHKDYWDKYGAQLDVIGTIFENGTTGLVVPDYVNIDSIEQLNANKGQFNGKIYGIGSGSGIHTNTLAAIKTYQLDFQQVTSSETTMITALKKAISKNEPIVITGWKPHFMWNDYKLKTLQDPKNVYPTDKIKIVAKKGFTQEQPELVKFFGAFVLDESLLYELMGDVQADQNPEIGAKIFYEKHKSEIDNWLKSSSQQ